VSARIAICLVALGGTLSGCAPLGASAPPPSPPPPKSSKLAQAQATHEYPSPPPAAQTAAGGSPSAARAVRAFATAYINWTADSVVADLRSLARQSVGQARSAMELAAAQTAGDYELQSGGIANSGAVEAVAALAHPRDEYVVVTRELTTATGTNAYQGLRPAWHVALATVVQLTPGRWVVTGWQPET
jgi:hypothetical protein